MKRKLHKNSYPFFILFVIHTGLLFYTFYKKKPRKPIFVLLMSNIGMAYLFEYIVLNIFQAYKYKPKIISKPYLDNIFGAMLSQTIFVPFTAVYLTVFKMNWLKRILISFYFLAIEKLFIRLKIYKTYWWKSIYTFLLITIFFLISDLWHRQLKKGKESVMFLSLFFMTMVTGANLLYVMAVARKFRFGRGRFHSWKEHFIVAPLYSISLSLFTAWMVFKNGGINGFIKSFVFVKIVDWCITSRRIVKQNFQSFLLNNSIHACMICLTYQYKKWIYDVVEQQN
ncbi:hypothetical protein HNQ94_001805 [Salirhabdus euzebyi]|uniref:Uncharacterized protein n=1 Tax=Salirhabdus euzebyi TaxID=394506 RepID=A0A841Q4Q0_9BACI|nr:hypothetical protein [Salirhabdus euzebyi]MBB6453357.1 hypothetical protein [Salirhabdus euzebyi]